LGEALIPFEQRVATFMQIIYPQLDVVLGEALWA
jgi:hypothetical protein